MNERATRPALTRCPRLQWPARIGFLPVHPPRPIDGEHVYEAATSKDAIIVVAMLAYRHIECRVLPGGDGRRFAFIPIDDQETVAAELIERWAPESLRLRE